MTPDPRRLFDALEATWPPEGGDLVGPFRLRRGGGGGQRVSAAVWDADGGALDLNRAEADLATAEARMTSWGQRPLFMLRGGQDGALDDLLSRRRYERRDRSLLVSGAVQDAARQELPRLRAIIAPPELAICRELWRAGGVGPARQAVIGRAPPPATAILGRRGDDPAGVLLVAVDGPIAMIHALFVSPDCRRAGIGRAMAIRAARWADAHGCKVLAAAVVAENAPASALFETLGLRPAASYHYRAATDSSS